MLRAILWRGTKNSIRCRAKVAIKSASSTYNKLAMLYNSVRAVKKDDAALVKFAHSPTSKEIRRARKRPRAFCGFCICNFHGLLQSKCIHKHRKHRHKVFSKEPKEWTRCSKKTSIEEDLSLATRWDSEVAREYLPAYPPLLLETDSQASMVDEYLKLLPESCFSNGKRTFYPPPRAVVPVSIRELLCKLRAPNPYTMGALTWGNEDGDMNQNELFKYTIKRSDPEETKKKTFFCPHREPLLISRTLSCKHNEVVNDEEKRRKQKIDLKFGYFIDEDTSRWLNLQKVKSKEWEIETLRKYHAQAEAKVRAAWIEPIDHKENLVLYSTFPEELPLWYHLLAHHLEPQPSFSVLMTLKSYSKRYREWKKISMLILSMVLELCKLKARKLLAGTSIFSSYFLGRTVVTDSGQNQNHFLDNLDWYTLPDISGEPEVRKFQNMNNFPKEDNTILTAWPHFRNLGEKVISKPYEGLPENKQPCSCFEVPKHACLVRAKRKAVPFSLTIPKWQVTRSVAVMEDMRLFDIEQCDDHVAPINSATAENPTSEEYRNYLSTKRLPKRKAFYEKIQEKVESSKFEERKGTKQLSHLQQLRESLSRLASQFRQGPSSVFKLNEDANDDNAEVHDDACCSRSYNDHATKFSIHSSSEVAMLILKRMREKSMNLVFKVTSKESSQEAGQESEGANSRISTSLSDQSVCIENLSTHKKVNSHMSKASLYLLSSTKLIHSILTNRKNLLQYSKERESKNTKPALKLTPITSNIPQPKNYFCGTQGFRGYTLSLPIDENDLFLDTSTSGAPIKGLLCSLEREFGSIPVVKNFDEESRLPVKLKKFVSYMKTALFWELKKQLSINCASYRSRGQSQPLMFDVLNSGECFSDKIIQTTPASIEENNIDSFTNTTMDSQKNYCFLHSSPLLSRCPAGHIDSKHWEQSESIRSAGMFIQPSQQALMTIAPAKLPSLAPSPHDELNEISQETTFHNAEAEILSKVAQSSRGYPHYKLAHHTMADPKTSQEQTHINENILPLKKGKVNTTNKYVDISKREHIKTDLPTIGFPNKIKRDSHSSLSSFKSNFLFQEQIQAIVFKATDSTNELTKSHVHNNPQEVKQSKDKISSKHDEQKVDNIQRVTCQHHLENEDLKRIKEVFVFADENRLSLFESTNDEGINLQLNVPTKVMSTFFKQILLQLKIKKYEEVKLALLEGETELGLEYAFQILPSEYRYELQGPRSEEMSLPFRILREDPINSQTIDLFGRRIKSFTHQEIRSLVLVLKTLPFPFITNLSALILEEHLRRHLQ